MRGASVREIDGKTAAALLSPNGMGCEGGVGGVGGWRKGWAWPATLLLFSLKGKSDAKKRWSPQGHQTGSCGD